MSTANWYNAVHAAAEKAGIELSKTKSDAFARALAESLKETLASGEEIQIPTLAKFEIVVNTPKTVRAKPGSTELKELGFRKTLKVSALSKAKEIVKALPVSKAEETEALANKK